MQPRVLILQANGTNRDQELHFAFELAGAQPEIISLYELRTQKKTWQDYQILAIAGGFSYGDILGAGKLLALDLEIYFQEELKSFIAAGKPVIGICNGFQTLMKTGVFSSNDTNALPTTTLTTNKNGNFECRWVLLKPNSKICLWTNELQEPIYCPVAHGEGRFFAQDSATINTLAKNQQIAFSYANPEGLLANEIYPFNPNGSMEDIAGICNVQGNVLGLMPHPEDHVLPYQHPCWTRGEKGRLGLDVFKNGVRYCE